MAQKLVVGVGLVDLSPAEQARYDADVAGRLDRVKENKRKAINAEREKRLNDLTVMLDGVEYDADQEGRANVTATVSAINAGVIPVPDPLSWRDFQNNTQSLSHAKLLELAGIMFAAVDSIYQTSWAIKSQIDSASTIEEVNAISWS